MHVFSVPVSWLLNSTINYTELKLFSDARIRHKHPWFIRTFFLTYLDFIAFPTNKRKSTVKTIYTEMKVISFLTLCWQWDWHKKQWFIFKILKFNTYNSYQSYFLLFQDNVYKNYRKVFYHLTYKWRKIWTNVHKLVRVPKLVRLPYYHSIWIFRYF